MKLLFSTDLILIWEGECFYFDSAQKPRSSFDF